MVVILLSMLIATQSSCQRVTDEDATSCENELIMRVGELRKANHVLEVEKAAGEIKLVTALSTCTDPPEIKEVTPLWAYLTAGLGIVSAGILAGYLLSQGQTTPP